MNISGLTIILPTLNEEENLKIIIPELVDVFTSLNFQNYEILVVDDSSEDATNNLINNLNKENKRIHLYERKEDRSLPMSIRDGVINAKYEYVMWLDADGSMGSEAVKKLIIYQDNNPASVIIGSRFVKGGGYKGIEVTGQTNFFKAMYNISKSNDSVLATILSKIFNNLLYFLLPSSVRDLTSGFIIGKKKYINENIFNISSYGDYFVYLVNDLHKNNIDILEVGYLCEMRIYGDSKTGSSISQLIKRGFPYLTAAVKCRISKYENL